MSIKYIHSFIHRPTSGGIQSNRYLGNQTRPAGHGSMNANRYTQVGLGVGEGVVTLTLLPNSYVGMAIFLNL